MVHEAIDVSHWRLVSRLRAEVSDQEDFPLVVAEGIESEVRCIESEFCMPIAVGNCVFGEEAVFPWFCRQSVAGIMVVCECFADGVGDELEVSEFVLFDGSVLGWWLEPDFKRVVEDWIFVFPWRRLEFSSRRSLCDDGEIEVVFVKGEIDGCFPMVEPGGIGT